MDFSNKFYFPANLKALRPTWGWSNIIQQAECLPSMWLTWTQSLTSYMVPQAPPRVTSEYRTRSNTIRYGPQIKNSKWMNKIVLPIKNLIEFNYLWNIYCNYTVEYIFIEAPPSSTKGTCGTKDQTQGFAHAQHMLHPLSNLQGPTYSFWHKFKRI